MRRVLRRGVVGYALASTGRRLSSSAACSASAGLGTARQPTGSSRHATVHVA